MDGLQLPRFQEVDKRGLLDVGEDASRPALDVDLIDTQDARRLGLVDLVQGVGVLFKERPDALLVNPDLTGHVSKGAAFCLFLDMCDQAFGHLPALMDPLYRLEEGLPACLATAPIPLADGPDDDALPMDRRIPIELHLGTVAVDRGPTLAAVGLDLERGRNAVGCGFCEDLKLPPSFQVQEISWWLSHWCSPYIPWDWPRGQGIRKRGVLRGTWS